MKAKVSGTAARPRLCVFRSLTHIYAQVIDDTSGHTLTSASTLDPKIRADVSSPQATRPSGSTEASVEASASTSVTSVEPSAETLTEVSPRSQEERKDKAAQAEVVGALVAKRALDKGVTTVVFDRGGYKYHGRVKALAEAARGAGLVF